MGIDSCQILFEDGQTIFFAGSTLRGYVRYNFTSPMEIRAIKARFKGECKTDWTRKAGKNTVREGGRHVYYADEHRIAVPPPNEDRMVIEAGIHEFPFSHQLLPDGLPPSFEGQFGYVRYTVKFIVDRPWKFDHEYKCAITVLAPFNLNLDASLLNPRQTTIEKRFCCWICISGPVTVNIRVPFGGYVPGQKIDIYGDYNSAINKDVDNLKIAFSKVVTYHSQIRPEQTKLEELTINRVDHGPIRRNTSGEFNYTMAVPALPPSHLPNCDLIEIKYYIEATLETDWLSRNQSGAIRIEIGTFPITGSYPNQFDRAGSAYMPVLPTERALNAPTAPKPPPYADVANQVDPYAPPPTYEESMFSRTDSIQDDNDNSHLRFVDNAGPGFSPRYPVFNFAPSAPHK